MTQKTALIAWGGWEGHTPEASANVVKNMLEKHNFKVTVEAGTQAFAKPNLGEFDLIVPMFTQISIKPDEVKNLIAAIEAGTGLAGCHGAMADSFRDEPNYQFMTGGQWVAHPGNIIDYSIQITQPDDPIVNGIGDFNYRSEQYYLHVDPAIEVLATTTFTGQYAPHIDGVVMPVVWKHKYYKARVFYSALGHTADEFKVPQMHEILERGLLWAAR
ncbi:MAG: ThuA domain-containing protein [Rhizobiales bacterium]|nr:ThuA domain-containing protein [Hyphomicrobiales bacterium]NRB15132.1 ThuA domain-containing protein [Hyphomicrobiales bacterium]